MQELRKPGIGRFNARFRRSQRPEFPVGQIGVAMVNGLYTMVPGLFCNLIVSNLYEIRRL